MLHWLDIKTYSTTLRMIRKYPSMFFGLPCLFCFVIVFTFHQPATPLQPSSKAQPSRGSSFVQESADDLVSLNDTTLFAETSRNETSETKGSKAMTTAPLIIHSPAQSTPYRQPLPYWDYVPFNANPHVTEAGNWQTPKPPAQQQPPQVIKADDPIVQRLVNAFRSPANATRITKRFAGPGGFQNGGFNQWNYGPMGCSSNCGCCWQSVCYPQTWCGPGGFVGPMAGYGYNYNLPLTAGLLNNYGLPQIAAAGIYPTATGAVYPTAGAVYPTGTAGVAYPGLVGSTSLIHPSALGYYGKR